MSAIVVKDCTGTYLRYDNKDHLICNEDKLDGYESGTAVNVSILRDDNCRSEGVHCAALHHYQCAEGNFWIVKIKTN
ncbi:MAG: hypothetical protein JNL60_12875 [Bacteroidia bacterium]|nr:hypothetical protein [Bacteroidia bacterium]